MTLIASDVPGDDPAVVGSGPTWPPRGPSTRPSASLGLSGDVVEVVAGLGRLRAEAAAAARADGWDVIEHEAPLVGDVDEVARVIVDAAAALPEGGAWIAGGEWTIALPENPGRGGRAAHLALVVARPIAPSEAEGRVEGLPVTVLVGASDGVDGTGPHAGAIVDRETWAQLQAAGIDPEDALRRFDAGAALATIGAGLAGGPTGVNHADLVVVVRPRRDRHAP